MLPFIEDNDQTRARRAHLDRITELIGNAYPNKFVRSRTTGGDDTITAIVSDKRITSLVPALEEGARPTPEGLQAANAELNQIEARVSGRLSVPPRVMGKAAFVHLSDGVSRLQIYVRRDDVKARAADGREVDAWELFGLLDHGDFIGVAGYLFITKTGELSIHVREIEFLAKALVPMPDKMHGIADAEIRQRQRYADLIAGSLKIEREAGELTPREVFERRSKLIREMRRYLDEHGYIEVETPMLTPIASGAAARPFETEHKALGIKLYARIAPELYLKRLLVGGFERVYELNRNFRNEGISTRHNPEFTMLEFYCAYMDVNGMMDFCEEMLRTTIGKATGSTCFLFGDDEIDFGRKFKRFSMVDAIMENWPPVLSEIGNWTLAEDWHSDPEYVHYTARFLRNWESVMAFPLSTPSHEIKSLNSDQKTKLAVAFVSPLAAAQQATEQASRMATYFAEEHTAQNIAEIFEIVAERSLIQPTFITDFPKPISPLSKASPTDPSVAERFELYVAGMEVANGFSELNDPAEQHERFLDQQAQRERGDEEAMRMDEDYLRALAYGMPPAAGIGIGIDRLTMLITNRRSIRDVILFPHMRPTQKAEATEQLPPAEHERQE